MERLHQLLEETQELSQYNSSRLRQFLSTTKGAMNTKSHYRNHKFEAFLSERDGMNRLLDSPRRSLRRLEVHEAPWEAQKSIKKKLRTYRQSLSKINTLSPSSSKQFKTIDVYSSPSITSRSIIYQNACKNSVILPKLSTRTSLSPKGITKVGLNINPGVGEYYVRYPERNVPAPIFSTMGSNNCHRLPVGTLSKRQPDITTAAAKEYLQLKEKKVYVCDFGKQEHEEITNHREEKKKDRYLFEKGMAKERKKHHHLTEVIITKNLEDCQQYYSKNLDSVESLEKIVRTSVERAEKIVSPKR